MSADKDPIQSTHETLALIADKLGLDRAKSADISGPDPPHPPPSPPPETTSAGPPPTKAEPGHEPISPVVEPASEPPQPAPPVIHRPPEPSPVAPVPIVTVQRQPLRDALLTYFPMTIAVLSIVLSIYQGYLFHQSLKLSGESIDVMQRNVARGEFVRACRDIIETYFQVKQKVSVLMPAADRSNVVGASRVTEANRLEAQAAVARFGGLGIYLANFQDDATRARYTQLTKTLTDVMDSARSTQLSDIDKLFSPADRLFGQMNDDCVRLSRAMRM